MRRKHDPSWTWRCSDCGHAIELTEPADSVLVQMHLDADHQKGPIMPTVPTPEPVMMSAVCSSCGLDWQEHTHTPTVMDCVTLLRRKLIEAQGEVQRLSVRLRERKT